MASRASRFVAWEAEKAGWKLANRGDTRYAAERRLFRKQVKGLRRDLQAEDLTQRRLAYVSARDAARAKQQDPEAARRSNEERELRKAEAAARVQRLGEQAKAEYDKHRLRASAKVPGPLHGAFSKSHLTK